MLLTLAGTSGDGSGGGGAQFHWDTLTQSLWNSLTQTEWDNLFQ